MAHVTKVIGMLIAVAASCGLANAQDMRNLSILTGNAGGTYHRFGRDIAEVVKECPAALEVRPSRGSLDNLGRLRKEPFTQLAIVQQDVLDYTRLSRKRAPALEDWSVKFKYVLPLYREEVHIIARRGAGLRTLADLVGKRVVVGERGSGTNLTATLVLWNANLLGGVEVVHVAPRHGVLRLLDLDTGPPVDAVFYVAGQPVPLLSGTDARVTERHLARLSLVAIPRDGDLKRYSAAEFTRTTYPWLDRSVATIALRAVLMTYDFKGRQCKNIAMVARLIKDNLDELQRVGHPKWRDVEFDTPVPGWDRYGCVAKGMTTPIDGCKFTAWDEEAPASAPPNVSTDCSQVCSPREKERNALLCVLCEDEAALPERRR